MVPGAVAGGSSRLPGAADNARRMAASARTKTEREYSKRAEKWQPNAKHSTQHAAHGASIRRHTLQRRAAHLGQRLHTSVEPATQCAACGAAPAARSSKSAASALQGARLARGKLRYSPQLRSAVPARGGRAAREQPRQRRERVAARSACACGARAPAPPAPRRLARRSACAPTPVAPSGGAARPAGRLRRCVLPSRDWRAGCSRPRAARRNPRPCRPRRAATAGTRLRARGGAGELVRVPCVRATSTAHASGRAAALRAQCVSARRLAHVQPGAGEVRARVAEVARGCARAAARAVQLAHGLRFRGELGFKSLQCDALLGCPCAAARNAGRACARAGVLIERASPRFHEKKRTCERRGSKLGIVPDC
jgi:hypothetical protein